MRKTLTSILSLIFLTLSVSNIKADTNILTSKQAKKIAGRWLNKNGNKTVVINVKSKRYGFNVYFNNPNTVLRYSRGKYDIELKFQSVLDRKLTFENFSGGLVGFSLHKISPFTLKKWKITFNTPYSSISEGFKVLSLKNNVIELKIKGTFFALSGRKLTRDCKHIMRDRAIPARCFFSIRKNLKYVIYMKVPLKVVR